VEGTSDAKARTKAIRLKLHVDLNVVMGGAVCFSMALLLARHGRERSRTPFREARDPKVPLRVLR
jgi:hypothetical protein